MRYGPVMGKRQIGAAAGFDFNGTIDDISRRLLDAIDIELSSNDVGKRESNGTLLSLDGHFG